jgi:hypothetical protein
VAGEEVLWLDEEVLRLTAPGGVGIASEVAGRTAPALLPGAGAWSMSSDRAAKRALEPVDASSLLAGIAALEIGSWSYRAAPGVPHLGPTAQDFRAAFGLGESDRTISMVDADGVALAGAQALLARMDTMAAEAGALRRAACGSTAQER